MLVQRKHFRELLSLCRKAVDPKSTNIMGSDLFIFRDNCVFAYNDLSYAGIPLQGSTEAFPNFCVRAEDLLQVLDNYSEETLEFTLGNNTLGILAGKKSKTELALLETDLYARILAILPGEDKDSWKPLESHVLNNLNRCFLGMTGSRVHGIYVDSQWMISSDNITMNFIEGATGFEQPLWLSDKNFKDLQDFCEKDSSLEIKQCYHDGWLFLRNPHGETLGFRNLRVDNYPREAYLKFRTQCLEAPKFLQGQFPTEIESILSRVKLFSTKYTKRNEAHIKFYSRGILVSAENARGRTSNLLEVEGSFDKEFSATVTLEGLEHLLSFSQEFYIIPTTLSQGRSGYAFVASRGPWLGVTLMLSLE